MLKCYNCEQNAVRQVQVGETEFPFCERCATHYELRKTFDTDFLQFVDFLFSDRYDEAAACLASLQDKYNGRDPLKKLDNQLLGFQAHLLTEQGRQEQALAIHHELKERTQGDFFAFVTNQLALANLLEQMGDPVASTIELSLGLEGAQQRDAPLVLDLLVRYREIAMNYQLPMDERLRPVIRSIVQWNQLPWNEHELATGSIESLVRLLNSAIKQ